MSAGTQCRIRRARKRYRQMKHVRFPVKFAVILFYHHAVFDFFCVFAENRAEYAPPCCVVLALVPCYVVWSIHGLQNTPVRGYDVGACPLAEMPLQMKFVSRFINKDFLFHDKTPIANTAQFANHFKVIRFCVFSTCHCISPFRNKLGLKPWIWAFNG